MILTIGPGGCGFTFLNWSICWLRGDTVYRNLDKEDIVIVNNPITVNNHVAHAFNKDHVIVYNKIPNKNFNTAHDKSVVYFVPSDQQDFNYIVGIPGKKIIFDAKEHKKEIFLRLISSIPTDIGTFEKLLSTRYNPNSVRAALLEYSNHFVDYYSEYSVDGAYIVSARDIFFDLDKAIIKIFKFLDTEIDWNRWQHWQKVYKRYQKINAKFFNVDFPTVEDKKETKQILKEFLLWKNGKHPHINRPLLTVV